MKGKKAQGMTDTMKSVIWYLVILLAVILVLVMIVFGPKMMGLVSQILGNLWGR